MTFQRPASVWLPPEVDKKGKELHARMAIYIDYYKYKPKEERDDALIYQYIYHISYMLACQHRMFNNGADYDLFALYCANVVYGRIVNEKQFVAEEGEQLMPQIGSVLNYIKASLLGMKVSYQKNEFQYIFDPELGFNSARYENNIKNDINDEYNGEYIREDTEREFRKIPSIVKKVIKSTPYSSDKIMSRRLYISCLLSFLNSVTFTNKFKEKLNKKEIKGQDSEKSKIDFFTDPDESNIVLWRIDNKLYDYVDILVKRVKDKVATDIAGIRSYYQMPDDILTQIMNSPLSEYSKHNQGDF